MYPKPTGPRGRLWILCALAAGIHAQTLPESETSLSPEESRILGLDPQPTRPDTASRPVVAIDVLGLDSGAIPFARSLLPLETGDTLLRADLDARLEAFNARIAGRTDLFDECRAMVLSTPNGWRVVVRASSRTFGTYGGGNAYGYFGHHNRTRVGDRWGVYLGANRIEGRFDAALVPGLYAGLDAGWNTPRESNAPDHGLQHWRASATVRKMASPTWSWDGELGPWVVTTDLPGRTRPEAVSLVAGTGVEHDQTWLGPVAGVGGTGRCQARLGRGLLDAQQFLDVQWTELWRTVQRDGFSGAAIVEGEFVADRPSFLPAPIGEFGVAMAGRTDSVISLAFTAALQPRVSIWRRDLWFTALDAGIVAHLEAYVAEGRSTHRGLAAGGGLDAAFRPPVAVDFQLLSAWDDGNWLGIRFVARQQF